MSSLVFQNNHNKIQECKNVSKNTPADVFFLLSEDASSPDRYEDDPVRSSQRHQAFIKARTPRREVRQGVLQSSHAPEPAPRDHRESLFYDIQGGEDCGGREACEVLETVCGSSEGGGGEIGLGMRGKGCYWEDLRDLSVCWIDG